MKSQTFRAPKVIWERDEVKKIIDAYGMERAIELISGKTFVKEYVKETIKTLMMEGLGNELVSTSGFFGKGTL